MKYFCGYSTKCVEKLAGGSLQLNQYVEKGHLQRLFLEIRRPCFRIVGYLTIKNS